MVVPDQSFQRKNYDFTFVRRPFLFYVCYCGHGLVAKKGAGNGLFLGRIWIEDQDYNIVRCFNGPYFPHPRYSYYLHFDSWRFQPRGSGVWLLALILVPIARDRASPYLADLGTTRSREGGG